MNIARAFSAMLMVAAICSAAGSSAGGQPSGTREIALGDNQEGQQTEPSESGAPALQLSFWEPDIGDGFAKLINGLVVDFNNRHPEIEVRVTYFSGGYRPTQQKIVSAKTAGALPDIAVTENASVPLLASIGAAQPLDNLIASAGRRKFLGRFWPSMLINCEYGGKIYAVPFQRSTPIMFYNKDAFVEAGLDPEQPPQTWDELASTAEKLTRREAGRVTRWGLEVPIDAWFYHAFAYANGGEALNAAGTKVMWDQPNNLHALQFWHDLVNKYQVAPDSTPDAAKDFIEGKAAMVWLSSATQVHLRAAMKSRWGLARIPKHIRFAVPSGGGNIMLYATDPDRQKAAWTFIDWVTDAPQAARLSIASGYIATNMASWERPEMQKLIEERPEVLVSKQQIEDAKIEPAAPKYPWGILTALVRDVLAGKAPLEPAVKAAVTKANASMAN